MPITESQRYEQRYRKYKGRGKMSARSLDVARTVLMNPELSYASIANRFGISRQRVGQIVRRMNVARVKKAGIQDG
jgi:DNA-binding CsgD family transcriptional regulator